MRSRLAFLGCVSLLALGGCSSSSPVQVTKDPEADFARYRSYAWLTPERASELRLGNPLIDYVAQNVHVVRRPELETKLRAEIERKLNEDGYQAATGSQAPDFYVTFYGKTTGDEWVSTWEGLTPGIEKVPVVIFPEYDRGEAHRYREGDISVTIYDARMKKPAWAGHVNFESKRPDLYPDALAQRVTGLVDAFKKQG